MKDTIKTICEILFVAIAFFALAVVLRNVAKEILGKKQSLALPIALLALLVGIGLIIRHAL